MELDTLTPDMPLLLMELGINYDPDRLAAVLNKRWPQVYARAVQVHGGGACRMPHAWGATWWPCVRTRQAGIQTGVRPALTWVTRVLALCTISLVPPTL